MINEITSRVTGGQVPRVVTNNFGDRIIEYSTATTTTDGGQTSAAATIQPQILLAVHYRVASYLGDYGAGKTVKTFSLLPGEKTTISIKTYKNYEST